MKKQILILIVTILTLGRSFAQAPCDISTGGVEVRNAANTANISSIPVGGMANFRFYIFNTGTSTGCTIPANTVEAVFDFPNVLTGPFVYSGPMTFTTGHFTFTFDAFENALVGTNNVAIPNNDGDDGILVQVTGVRTGVASAALNLTQGGAVSDNTGNNNGSAPLTVAAVVPVRINDISTEVTDCSAKLQWATSLEDANTSFDIEYSPDGINYIKVANIEGRHLASGASYQYSYPQGNGKGYYRLKLKGTGAESYSRVVTANVKCNAKKVFIYPNPVISGQTLHINVSNYEGAVRGELTNEAGQVVLTRTLKNGANDLTVTNLAQGTYNFKVFDDNKETQTYKVVVVK